MSVTALAVLTPAELGASKAALVDVVGRAAPWFPPAAFTGIGIECYGFSPLQMPMSRALKQLADAALERSRRLDEPVAGLDFAWTTGSQDGGGDIERTLVVRTIAQTQGNAVVEARFRDPEPRVVQYRVVKEEGGWVIDDIEYPAIRRRLARLLARGAKGES